MSVDLEEELRAEIIREHFKTPKYRRDLTGIPYAENPSCGDQVRIAVELGPNGAIRSAAFDGHGCSISMSSADILAQGLIGLSPAAARARIASFLAFLRGEGAPSALDDMGDAVVFKDLARYPVRAKCAALAWKAAMEALGRAGE